MVSFADLTRYIGQCYTGRSIRYTLQALGFGWTSAPVLGEPAEYVAAAALARMQVGA